MQFGDGIFGSYSSVGDMIVIFLCILLFLLIQNMYIESTKKIKYVKVSLLSLIFASTCNIFYHISTEYIGSISNNIIYTLRNSYYCSLLFILTLYVFYINELVNLEGKQSKQIKYLTHISFLGFSIFECLTPFHKLGYYIDENFEVHVDYFKDIFTVGYCFYIAFILMILFKYKKYLINKLFNIIVGSIFLAVGLVIFQASFKSVAFFTITFLIPVLGIFFMVHSTPFDLDTGTFSFDVFDKVVNEYIKEHRNFGIIFLSLKEFDKNKIDKDFKITLYHFYEKFFNKAYAFRLKNGRFALIFDKKKNKVVDIDSLYKEFLKLYDMYNFDYKLAIFDSNEYFNNSKDIYDFFKYLEKNIVDNSFYFCEEEDYKRYLNMIFVLNELKDIYKKDDLNDERVLVYCQPVLNTHNNKYTSAEVLMRLKLPDIGLVFPDVFIPIAEDNGYIHALSKIILNKTCQQIKLFLDSGLNIDRVSVNFSSKEFLDDNFVDEILEIIKKNNIPFDKIAIELTESSSLENFEIVKKVITILKEYGIKFYLDDFGTGYSNFERIAELPIDVIKFDRSLVILSNKDEGSKYMVSNFANVFKFLGYDVLFEGIEDENDENLCKDMQANYLQGYKYSRPIPIEGLENFLDNK